MPVSCITMVDMLDRYVDGELPVAARARTEAHLVACPGCRRYVERLEDLRGLLRRELGEPARAVDLSGVWPAIEARLGSAAVGATAGTADGAAGLAEEVDRVPSGSDRRTGTRAKVLRFPAAARLRRLVAARRPAGPVAAAIAAVLLLALALPLANVRVDPIDRAATVASVESDASASVVLLAGTPSRPPVIWVTETASLADEESSL